MSMISTLIILYVIYHSFKPNSKGLFSSMVSGLTLFFAKTGLYFFSYYLLMRLYILIAVGKTDILLHDGIIGFAIINLFLAAKLSQILFLIFAMFFGRLHTSRY